MNNWEICTHIKSTVSAFSWETNTLDQHPSWEEYLVTYTYGAPEFTDIFLKDR